jgi:hypothetical protein
MLTRRPIRRIAALAGYESFRRRILGMLRESGGRLLAIAKVWADLTKLLAMQPHRP